jgi:D-psicose/D-tagatose/L-ribulose 3-epimerase
MIRRDFLAMMAGTTAASLTGGAVPSLAAGAACGNFHLRYGVTQAGNFDLLNNTDTLAKWGFEYCEPSVVKVMSLSDADFETTRAKIAATPVHVESMNVLLPGDLKVVGPDVDQAKIKSYIESAFVRAGALGTKIVVFGSGGARKVPDGFSQTQAWSQLVDFLRLMGEEIDRKKYGFVIGIEALRKEESNIINKTADAYQLALDSKHPKINIICDFFHLASENEDPKVLLRVKDRLVHLHFANECNKRLFPKDPGECPAYSPFFANLREIGYQGRISIEAGTTDFNADAPVGLATLHQLYAAACAA